MFENESDKDGTAVGRKPVAEPALPALVPAGERVDAKAFGRWLPLVLKNVNEGNRGR